MLKLIFISLFLLFPQLLFAHGGGLDSYGCHHNRKQGDYHCHRGTNAGHHYSSKAEMLQSANRELYSDEIKISDTSKYETPKPTSKPDKSQDYIHEHEGKVVGITDGDTLTLLVDNRQIKIRLAQIDTPEKGQPYGTRAKQALSDLTYGKTVTAKVETIDRYGRSVSRIFVDDLDVSAELVKSGAAWVYRKYATDNSLYELENKAHEEGLGLWALPEAQRVPPWEWRKIKRRR